MFVERFKYPEKEPYIRGFFVVLGVLLIPLSVQAQSQADVRGGVFSGNVDVGVAGSSAKDKKSARKSFNPYSSNQYYTAKDLEKIARKPRVAKAPSIGPILEPQAPKPKAKKEKKQDVVDSFAVPEAEAKAAARIQDSLDIGMFERTLPKRIASSERKHRRVTTADKKIKSILQTMDKLNNGLAKSGLGAGGVSQSNIAEAIEAVRTRSERASNPEIERQEKARSNRF